MASEKIEKIGVGKWDMEPLGFLQGIPPRIEVTVTFNF